MLYYVCMAGGGRPPSIKSILGSLSIYVISSASNSLYTKIRKENAPKNQERDAKYQDTIA